MKNFEKKATDIKPARKIKKRNIAAIMLTAAVAVGALTGLGIFGSKMMKKNVVSDNQLTAAPGDVKTSAIGIHNTGVFSPANALDYHFFAPGLEGDSNSWELVKGGEKVNVTAEYNNRTHVYDFRFTGKEKGVVDVILSYKVKNNKIETAKMTFNVDENMNVTKIC